MDYQLTLFDRVNVIKDTISKFGEENFYLSFSGGKDSTIIHHLLDMAIPGNKIPRVFINTGIEYNAIVEFVKELQKNDSRFVIIQPKTPIVAMLKKFGYPFKSKEHSLKVGQYQKGSRSKSVLAYKNGYKDYRYSRFACPKELLYQYEEEFGLRLSNQCCYQLKKNPAHEYERESGRSIPILGLRQEEGGQRKNHKGCAVFDETGRLTRFKPLNPISDAWEDEFVERERVLLCKLYLPPFNFKRTGCKGCPYALGLQEQLEIMERLMPSEAAQCEFIWKPVYDEYRRLGYRLDKVTQIKLF